MKKLKIFLSHLGRGDFFPGHCSSVNMKDHLINATVVLAVLIACCCYRTQAVPANSAETASPSPENVPVTVNTPPERLFQNPTPVLYRCAVSNSITTTNSSSSLTSSSSNATNSSQSPAFVFEVPPFLVREYPSSSSSSSSTTNSSRRKLQFR